MTLTPAEATPRALALLTLAHELYTNIDAENALPHTELDEAEMRAVLADDDGEIDWQAIAIAMAMVGHVLLDTIPEKLYEASEKQLTEILAQHFRTTPDALQVTINNKVTGTNLLRAVSLKVLEMNSHE